MPERAAGDDRFSLEAVGLGEMRGFRDLESLVAYPEGR